MRTVMTKAFVRAHDRKLQRKLQQDEEGLSLLAYALGAAVIVAPLAVLLFQFGDSAVKDASAEVKVALTGGGGAVDPA